MVASTQIPGGAVQRLTLLLLLLLSTISKPEDSRMKKSQSLLAICYLGGILALQGCAVLPWPPYYAPGRERRG